MILRSLLEKNYEQDVIFRNKRDCRLHRLEVCLLLVVILASCLCGTEKKGRLHGQKKQDAVRDVPRNIAPHSADKGTSRRHTIRLICGLVPRSFQSALVLICGLVEVEL